MSDDQDWNRLTFRSPRSRASWLAAACTLVPVAAFSDAGPASRGEAALRGQVRIPLHFEANAGQADRRVQFLARGAGFGLFLTAGEAVLALPQRAEGDGRAKRDAAVVRMRLLGSNRAATAIGADALPGRSHFFMGPDPSRWRRGVPQFARVEYRDVYPGVDLAYHGREGRLEYDFVVRPGADPRAIRLRFAGASSLRIDARGDLVLATAAGSLVQPAPLVYQERSGVRTAVRGRYVLQGQREVVFDVGPYDHSRTLVIDPVLSYSTYFGGDGWDGIEQIALDGAGNIYLAGWTHSNDFPLAAPIQPARAGDFDAFIAKLDPTGATLLFSTYLGGTAMDLAISMAISASGEAQVAGLTDSSDFPTFAAVQPQSGGGRDAFLARLAADGSALVYSTYLGGSADDRADGVAVDPAGNAYVTGTTLSTNFPTLNPLQPSSAGLEDAFVAKLAPSGSALAYSTYLGGTINERGFDIAADAAGNAYLAGFTQSNDFPTVNPLQAAHAGRGDIFVARLDAAGSALTYSSYLGGSDVDYLPSIALDASLNIYVAGTTYSADFPTRKPLQAGKDGGTHGFGSDGFVARIAAGGSALVYATYLGGEGNDFVGDLAVNAGGYAYVVGDTNSSIFPMVAPIKAQRHGLDAFVAKLDPQGTALVYSTYLGGQIGFIDAADSVAVNATGTAYLAGRTDADDFALVTPFQDFHAGFGDGFVSAIGPTCVPRALVADGPGSPSSNGNGVVEPGETVTISPSWFNDRVQAVTVTGVASEFTGPPGATYTVVDGAAAYGTLPPAAASGCAATGDCYTASVSAPPVRPQQHWDARLAEELGPTGEFTRWRLHIGGSFSDVPASSPFYRFVETLFHRGVTSGCAVEDYCPASPVTREQMAVFVLAGREWPGYVPASCAAAQSTFGDVPASSPFCRWIEELARRAIVSGCGGGNYCPSAAVSREQMPVYVLAALEGRNYRPPACTTSVFADVQASSPFCPWIQELARRGVVGGCGGGNYCPGGPVSREQMAVFVSAGFGLDLYAP